MAAESAAAPDDIREDALGSLSVTELAIELSELGNMARMRDARGSVAFAMLCEYQELLANQEYGLDEDHGYIMGGFRSAAHVRNLMSGHALHEADECIRRAVAKIKFKGTKDNILSHPCHDVELAWNWIIKSRWPLFSERLYRRLRFTRDNFFTAFTEFHIDAAVQKTQIARELMQSGEDDALGLRLMKQVLENHLKRTGMAGNDRKLQTFMGADMKDLLAIHGHFQRKKFRALVGQAYLPPLQRPAANEGLERLQDYFTAMSARREHKFPRGSFGYCKKFIKAGRILSDSHAIEDQPETYEGLGLTAQEFNKEFQYCVETLARRHLERIVKDPHVTDRHFQAAKAFFEYTRKLYGDVPPPQDVNPAYGEDDYWLDHVFKEYGIRSYTKCYDDMLIMNSRGLIDTTLNAVGLSVSLAYEDLDEAEGMLEQARYPTDDAQELADIHINYADLTSALMQTAPTAANYYWWNTFHGGRSTEEKIDLMGKIFRAAGRIEGCKEEYSLVFSNERLDRREAALFIRHAQEMIAESRIAVNDTTMAYTLMNLALADLKDVGARLEDPRVYRGMGLSAADVTRIMAQYKAQEAIEHIFSAQDEMLTPRQRFEKLLAVKTILDDPKNPSLIRPAIEKYLGKDVVEGVFTDIRKLGLKIYHEMMGIFEDNLEDVFKAYDAIDLAKTALEAAHGMATKDPLAYHRVTGADKSRLAEFLAEHARYRRLAENWVWPARTPFKRADVIASLEGAMKLQGRKAYNELLRLSRQLRDQGRSLMDPRLLKRVRLTPRRLQSFIDAQALKGAEHFILEAQKPAPPVTRLHLMKDHPYTQYRAALSWVARTSYSPLSDKPWRKLGLEGRADFQNRFRASLKDLTEKLEDAIIHNGHSMPPYEFIQTLREIQNAYHTLGTDEGEQKLGRETVRRAIRGMGYEACIDALASSRPATAKFKTLSSVLTYASAMDARTWTKAETVDENTVLLAQKKADVNTLNRAFMGLIETRITGALTRFNARYSPDARKRHVKKGSSKPFDPLVSQPYIGVMLVCAIQDMRKAFNLDQQQWFAKAFEPLGFGDFESFAYHMAYLRIRQIVARTRARIDRLGLKTDKPQAHIAILRDMENIDDIVKRGIINARERIQVFRELETDEGWMRKNRQFSAPFALKLFDQNAQVPLLTAQERLTALDEAHHLGLVAGTRIMRESGIDWGRNTRSTARAARHAAALYLITEFMRTDNGTISPAIVNAAFTMARGGNFVGNIANLRAMGLTQEEAENLRGMTRLIDVYQPLQTVLKLKPDASGVHRHNTLLVYLTELKESGLDITAPENLKRLGFGSLDEYKDRIDSVILKCLAGIREGADQARARSDAKQVRLQLGAMLEIMDISGIESRHVGSAFEQAGALTRKEIEAIYRTVAQPPVPAARPA